MTPAWSLENLSARQGRKTVLNAVSLEVRPGEVVGVVGPNGAGKTSLLRAGLGLLPLQGGDVSLAGRRLAGLGAAERASLVGYLPQDRRLAWNLPAEQVVALGAVDLPEGQALELARDRLARVGAGGLARRGVLDMSGGERARVLLARLLATRAPLMVADEPVAGLDPDAQILTLDLLRAEAAGGAAVVVTLHDLSLAARGCDRLIVIKAGRIVADAPPASALSPEVLAEVFNLKGRLVETEAGPVVAGTRL
jgi:iron complex transport system ATP-binding protein